LTQKELRDARRNRWLLLYAAAFAVLSLALAWLALAVVGGVATVGFFLGLAQSESVVPATPAVLATPGQATPALVYADLRDHRHGPNADFESSLASLIARSIAQPVAPPVQPAPQMAPAVAPTAPAAPPCAAQG
jgi:hypothetical protein